MSMTGLDLILKFITTFLVAVVSFMVIDGNTWIWPFIVGTVGTVINYELGDFILLPKYGSLIASFSEGVMVILTAYFVDMQVSSFTISFVGASFFGIVVGLWEYFFHQYLKDCKEWAE